MVLGIALVFCGGGIGASLRYMLLRLAATWGIDSAWGVLLVNLLGSFALGLLLSSLLGRLEFSEHWRLFLMTGVISGFTTFATLAADVVRLSERGNSLSMLYLLASIAGGVLLMVWGMRLGRGL